MSEVFGLVDKHGIPQTRCDIFDSAKKFLLKRQEPRKLEVLEVVWHEDQLYVAGAYNRRLCMYLLTGTEL